MSKQAPTTTQPQQQYARIPLQSFTLPTFPPETLTNPKVAHLILTSDIPLSSYAELLSRPFTIPPLPSSITSLTLESFALGYPQGFLPILAARLKGVKRLVVFEQVFGATELENDEAVNFVEEFKEVREVHFLGVLMAKGVMRRISEAFGKKLEFVEISYTYRVKQVDLLPEIGDFEGLVREGIKGLRIAMIDASPEPNPEVEEGKEKEEMGREEMGILPPLQSGVAVRSLLDKILALETLILLDLTFFPISTSSLLEILTTCKTLKVLSVTLILETSWEHVFELLRGKVGTVENLEIVGYPGDEEVAERLKSGGGEGESWLKESWVKNLGAVDGVRISVNILRTRGEEWREVKESLVKV